MGTPCPAPLSPPRWKGARAGQQGCHRQELLLLLLLIPGPQVLPRAFSTPQKVGDSGEGSLCSSCFWPTVTSLAPSVEKQPDVKLGMWLFLDAERFLLLMWLRVFAHPRAAAQHCPGTWIVAGAGSVSLFSFCSYFPSYFSLETFSHPPSVPWMVRSRRALHSAERMIFI